MSAERGRSPNRKRMSPIQNGSKSPVKGRKSRSRSHSSRYSSSRSPRSPKNVKQPSLSRSRSRFVEQPKLWIIGFKYLRFYMFTKI